MMSWHLPLALGISWVLFAQMPFIHSLSETYWGLRSVRSVLQETDPLIYRPLIRLALWRSYRANDELSLFLSFSVNMLSPPPTVLYQRAIPCWPPPSPHPTLKLRCSSWVAHFCPTVPLELQQIFISTQSLLWIKPQLSGEFTLHNALQKYAVMSEPSFVFCGFISLSNALWICLFEMRVYTLHFIALLSFLLSLAQV